jgi:transposase
VPAVPRYRVPDRSIRLTINLEEALAPHHPARMLWEALGRLDLSEFDAHVKAVEGRAGRRRHDPRTLLTLWTYAFCTGVIHAREIARRVGTDLPFRWIVGDVKKVDHSILSDFLSQHRDAILGLMPRLIGTLVHEGRLGLPTHELAQDGVKLSADASLSSFKRAGPLEECIAQAKLHLHAVLARMEVPPPCIERGTATRA